MINNNSTYTCMICGGEFSEFLSASDKMYGKSEIYTYGKCINCECLQKLEMPINSSDLYPDDYYSFNIKIRSGFKKFKRRLKLKLIFNHPNFLSPAIKLITKNYEKFWTYRNLKITNNHSILDVGTGSGEHVIELIDAGFNNVIGIDPHIESDVIVNNKLIVKKDTLSEAIGKFDLITFHHSLEHMNDQIEVLNVARECLNENGLIMIRIPTISSLAYKKYKENWFQLDAPRHLFLHSHKSIQYVAEKANLRITKLWCDSNELQFLISEEYANGIYGNSALSHLKNKKNNVKKQNLANLKLIAKNANLQLEGDQICLVLQK